MTDLSRVRLTMEQQAYEDIRKILVEDYLADPPRFIREYGCRPEDMNGDKLRSTYRDLHRQPDFKGRSKLYIEKFTSGKFFPLIVVT